MPPYASPTLLWGAVISSSPCRASFPDYDDTALGVEGSPAPAALVRVYERILEWAVGRRRRSARLLAAAGHAGALMGQAGKRIENMRADTGARIIVLPPLYPPPQMK